ncbi:hypothetical protein [Herbaspirillum sp. NPDC101397]|uniref:hypothetical protein n=1 Tax=Herbaspirillum sp. NPDC101397 TaxID=3364006 RepID=UPI00383B5164
MSEWEKKVSLKEGETLRHDRSFLKGFMQEEDVDLYTIVGCDGTVRGNVKVTDHTAVKGFRRTVTVVQTDPEGKTVFQESWNP